MKSKRILFLVPYPIGESPSQRFRFEQYFSILTTAGYQFNVQTFLDASNWKFFFHVGGTNKKALALLKGFARRFLLPFHALSYDLIFIHRETSPIGPPVFEWLLAKLFGKKLIYDFDDAIWLTDNTKESVALKFFKARQKVGQICEWSHKVSCGNSYLASFANRFNDHVVINPTTIDTAAIRQRKTYTVSDRVIVGWTGSHSTLKYLEILIPVFQELKSNYSFVDIMVIANKKPVFLDDSVTFIPWRRESEIEDLCSFDIGIMPLPDDAWTKGKCGFKILQYMAIGIPAIASPVGVNTDIIEDGVNGFLCTTKETWIEKLSLLIESASLRKQMGEQGRLTVQGKYSVSSNTDNFLKLFE